MHGLDLLTPARHKKTSEFASVPLGTPANPWKSAVFVSPYSGGFGEIILRVRGKAIERRKRNMRREPKPNDQDFELGPYHPLVPYNFEAAARAAAHRNAMPVTEYCRRALLLRLEADGVRLGDYSEHATAA